MFAAEATNGGSGSPTAQYDVFTFSLTDFAALSGGSATIHLTFSGPDGGLFGPTTTNGGAILFSTLTINTQPSNTTVPEPGTWILLASGISILGGARGAAFRPPPVRLTTTRLVLLELNN